jgi:hypothetical protein
MLSLIVEDTSINGPNTSVSTGAFAAVLGMDRAIPTTVFFLRDDTTEKTTSKNQLFVDTAKKDKDKILSRLKIGLWFFMMHHPWNEFSQVVVFVWRMLKSFA